MKLLNLFFVSVFCSFVINAQVGVNTTSPKAMLDIPASSGSSPASTDGILIPRVSAFPSAGSDQEGMLIYFLGNAGNPKGFYYWNNPVTKWEPIVVPFTDADWFKQSTTDYPKDNTDNIFTLGNVGIGHDSANYSLDIFSNTATRAISVDIGGSPSVSVYGNYISNYSSTTANNSFGSYNRMSGSSAYELIGTCNEIISSTGERHTGITNIVEGSGNGPHKGIDNFLGGTGTGIRYGMNNTFRGSGNAIKYGIYNDFFTGKSSGDSHGMFNVFYGTGAGSYDRYGVFNNFPSQLTQSGELFGVYNTFDSPNNGTHYGVKNELRGSGSGIHYGSYNEIVNGTGTNYGVYSKVPAGASNYAGFFEGKLHVDQAPIVLRDMAVAPTLSANQSGLFSLGGELRAIDAANNVTVISPHNFSLTKPSHPMAWSFYSKNENLGQQINVDMMKAIQTIENISGEKLLHLASLEGELIETKSENKSLVQKVEEQSKEIEDLKSEIQSIKLMLKSLSK